MGTINEFMDQDHSNLDQLWESFLSEKNDPKKAGKLFEKFQNKILKHIKFENFVLFPLFENHTGLIESGPTTILRNDHENIIKLLLDVKNSFETNDIRKISYSGNHLSKALNKHRERENQMQYPVLDSFISDEQWKKIIKKYN